MLVEHLNWRVLDAEISDVGLRILIHEVCSILQEIDWVVRQVIRLPAQQRVWTILKKLLCVALRVGRNFPVVNVIAIEGGSRLALMGVEPVL